MVLHLAEHLDVPLRDRNQLLLSAGFAPVYPESSLHSPQMMAIREALRRLLAGHDPYPAVVVDRWWNLVEANDALLSLVTGVAEHLLSPPINVLRLSLHPEGIAPQILNLGEWRGHLLGRLRRQVALTADPELADLLAELTEYPCDQPDDADIQGPGEVVVPHAPPGRRHRAGDAEHGRDLRYAARRHRRGAGDRDVLPGRRGEWPLVPRTHHPAARVRLGAGRSTGNAFPHAAAWHDGQMAIHITGDERADQLLTDSPFALLCGMLLDQQFPMERAFAGPAKVLERFGNFEPADDRCRRAGELRLAVRRASRRAPLPGLDG